MRRTLLTVTLILASFGLPMSNSSHSIAGKSKPNSGMCSTCQMDFGGCFVCTGAFEGEGGFGCLAWCDMCFVQYGGECPYPDGMQSEHHVENSQKLIGRTLKAPSKSILNVAAGDPYLALALLKLREIPIMGEYGKLYLSPVAISATDIGDLLDSGRRGSKSISRLYGDALQANRLIATGKTSPIVCSVLVKEPDSAAPVISIRVEKTPFFETLYRTLEIKVVPGEEVSTKRPLWKIKEWNVN
ncbi:MAG: hypothetical protein WBV94_10590 [Blastocatellia bacterium]